MDSYRLSRELGVYMKKTKILWAFLGTVVLLSLLFAGQSITEIRLWDTDQSHYLDLVWYENDTDHRDLRLLVDGATRSLTISSNIDLNAALAIYSGISPSANVQTLLANATFALFLADLSGTADAPFDWNAQLLDDALGYCYKAVTTATPSAAFTVDWTANQNHQVTITGADLDITFTNPPGPCRLTLMIIQGAGGGHTIDWTNEADLKFPGDVDPTLSTGAGDIDFVSFWWNGTFYIGVANYDFI